MSNGTGQAGSNGGAESKEEGAGSKGIKQVARRSEQGARRARSWQGVESKVKQGAMGGRMKKGEGTRR
jgi:hypothetical protein